MAYWHRNCSYCSHVYLSSMEKHGASIQVRIYDITSSYDYTINFPILIYIKEKAKSLQSELDAANKQIVQQEERQRIARDLHDTLGQTLTMIKLKSELTTRLVDKDSSKAKEELKEILATTRIALKQVRS